MTEFKDGYITIDFEFYNYERDTKTQSDIQIDVKEDDNSYKSVMDVINEWKEMIKKHTNNPNS